MSRITVTVAVLLFLFSSTYAQAPLDQTENEVIGHDLSRRTLPDPETKTTTTILLPSEKPEFEPANVVELEPDLTDSKTPESDDATVESSEQSTEIETDSVPLTIIRFRPINRHFPRRPMLPFHRSHRCRHQHRQQMKPWGPGFRGREVSFGDDMIFSSFKDVGPDPLFHGGVRQIPARWMRFHHDRARYPYLRKEHMRWAQRHGEEEAEGKREEHMMWANSHGEKEEEEKREEHHEKEHHDHHHENGWLMKKVRKFLNHFDGTRV